ncbi:HTH-type transcriptional regulator UlaR [Providencia zhijiangensis]|uniref:HTH-type transcriptional regulator UlaR n=1 Tax=Providencia zhijiangensis TaxID=3053982 RepID=A0ABZ0N1H0_9GAMM|nr:MULTISPECIES: HTH-type transcriptional regulator UlaR [Providencia]WPA92227.1 HTH-type transcriptional regulator UlaR [Providencia sp. D4759]HEQ1859851.1 HTH-type transcriptional regulator UlaR [Providencia alcalifaciens]
MNETQRHHEILSLLKENQIINVSFITKHFDISPATARRDIAKLDEQGKLKKIRNGAERIEEKRLRWSPLNINSTDHYEEKSQIAMKAAELCQPGDSAVINCGSTAFLLGQQLCGKGVQIVTNYFPLASYLIEEEHEDVILIGGQYNRTQGIFLNPALSTLMGYAGNWMFTSGKGLTETGLYKTDMLTAVAEQQMLDRIDKLVVVVDSSKVGSRTGMLFCPAEKIDYLITGKNADPKIIKAIEAQGTQVILV